MNLFELLQALMSEGSPRMSVKVLNRTTGHYEEIEAVSIIEDSKAGNTSYQSIGVFTAICDVPEDKTAYVTGHPVHLGREMCECRLHAPDCINRETGESLRTSEAMHRVRANLEENGG